GLDALVCEKLGLPAREADLGEWLQLTERIRERDGEVQIALVGKYVKLQDAYLSVHEALNHAGVHHGCSVNVRWVDAEGMSLDAARRPGGRARLGNADPGDLRRGGDPRAPPAPLRGQQPLPASPRRRGARRLGNLPGGASRRNRRAARTSLVRRRPVPSRVQV